MINYEWKVHQIEVVDQGDLEDVVVVVCFTINADDDGVTAFVQGDTRLGQADVANFTKLDKLTEEQVTDWVKAALGQELISSYEDRLTKQIESQKPIQPKVVPLPWIEIKED